MADLRMRATDLRGAVLDPVQLVAVARTLASLLGITVRDTPDGPPRA
jgi:hypothetical protein